MNQHATAAEQRYMGLIRSMKCLICRRFPNLDEGLPTEVHHLGEGSSRQNNWMVVPLCGSRLWVRTSYRETNAEDLAAQFNIGKGTILAIARGHSWKHIK